MVAAGPAFVRPRSRWKGQRRTSTEYRPAAWTSTCQTPPRTGPQVSATRVRLSQSTSTQLFEVRSVEVPGPDRTTSGSTSLTDSAISLQYCS